MSLIKDHFNWMDAWEEICETQADCLEDFEPKLHNLDIDLAKKFMREQNFPIMIDECYIENNLITFVFGEEYPTYGETNVCEDYVSITFKVDLEDELIQEIYLDN